MPTGTAHNLIDLVLNKLPDAKRCGKGHSAKCPAHEDHKPSLRVWVREDGSVGIKCMAGCPIETVLAALGLTMADLYPQASNPCQSVKPKSSRKSDRAQTPAFPTIEAYVASLGGRCAGYWTYADLDSNAVLHSVRINLPNCDKEFRQLHPVPGGVAFGGVDEKTPLLYLSDIRDADTIYVFEGERCAEAARTLGFAATTWAGGCNATHKTDWMPCAGKVVYLFPDNDPGGEKACDWIAEHVTELQPTARVKFVRLPGLELGGDIVDYIAARNSQDSSEIAAGVMDLINGAQWYVGKRIGGPVLVCISDVQPRPVEWLWPGRFAIGKLTLLAGDPGLGKSFLTLDMAARVSTGTPWPDRRSERNDPGDVILLSAEDDLEDTIRPRLDAAGANVERIHAIQGVNWFDEETDRSFVKGFNLEVDLPALESAIQMASGCRLVVIDPVTAFCGKADSHKNADIRGLLAPLSKLAGDYRLAVVAVTHLNKSGGPNALYRAMGSLAFVAAARAVWLVTKDADSPSRRLILPAKNNLGPDITGLAYSLMPAESGGAAVVAWEDGPVTMNADEALAAHERQGEKREKGRVEASGDWLRDQLGGGPLPKLELERRARDAGVSWASVRRAQHILKIRPHKVKGDPQGPWLWALPVQGAQEVAPPDSIEQVEHLEHLPHGAIEIADSDPDEQGQSGEGAQFGSGSKVGAGGQLWDDPDLADLVPDGWVGPAWLDRLEQLASGCESLNPDLAAHHRKQAAVLRAALNARGGDFS